jgi:DNA-binding transcriptional regulator YiaG
MIKTIREDLPPRNSNAKTLQKALLEGRLHLGLTRDQMASKLHASTGTLKNWEHGRTSPIRRFWPAIYALSKVSKG